MHCPNVWPGPRRRRGRTRVRDDRDVGDARHRQTCALFETDSAVPLIVGGRQTIVGSAPGTSRSMANFLVPVTMSSASIRGCGVPISVCCVGGFSCAEHRLRALGPRPLRVSAP